MKRYLTIGITFGVLVVVVVAISWFAFPAWKNPASGGFWTLLGLVIIGVLTFVKDMVSVWKDLKEEKKEEPKPVATPFQSIQSQQSENVYNVPGGTIYVVQQEGKSMEVVSEIRKASESIPNKNIVVPTAQPSDKAELKKGEVFISYSHKDEDWKDRLVTHLLVLQIQDVIEVWDDRRIEVGDDWRPEIEDAINRASIAVLMISANFLTSKFILDNEVPKLLERRKKGGLRVIPLIVKSCAWKQVKWLSEIQGRPKDNQPLSSGSEHQIDTNLAALAEEIAAIVRAKE
jgi:hypothetical protein